MEESKYVLAMYDVRGKQDYIFKSTKLKEIVGASMIIRDVYDDYLMTSVDKTGVCNIDNTIKLEKFESGIFKPEDADEFSREKYEEHLKEGYVGEIIYNGGGNFVILFKNEDIFKEVTHCFTYKVLANTGSLRVIGTCIEHVNFDDYNLDRDRLYKKHRITENTIQNLPADCSLPIGMVDPNSFMPIVTRVKENKELRELTLENVAKREKYKEVCANNSDEFNENILDEIAPQKGVDSHIAIIYADGNNMGKKVIDKTKDCKTYEESIKALRNFSKEIQNEFIDSKKEIIDKKIQELHGDNIKRRLVLGAGDEINIIVAGVDAYEVAKEYLKSLDAEKNYSSCAGIAIFRSHMPYADAYRIAEECCESGKTAMKKHGIDNGCYLDFHYCQGAIDVSLDQIREDEESINISRPWKIVCNDKKEAPVVDEEQINVMKIFLNGIGHSNVKCLLEPAKHSAIRLEDELNRIKAHQSEDKRRSMSELWTAVESMDRNERRKLMYDMVLVYDIWFK